MGSPAALLAELEAADQFVARHIGASDDDIAAMLLAIGRASLDDAASAAVPAAIRSNAELKLPPPVDETAGIAGADEGHPQTRAVLTTGAHAVGISLGRVGEGTPFAILLQYPGTTGEVRDLTAEIAAAKAKGALAIVAADPLALVLLKPPGE